MAILILVILIGGGLVGMRYALKRPNELFSDFWLKVSIKRIQGRHALKRIEILKKRLEKGELSQNEFDELAKENIVGNINEIKRISKWNKRSFLIGIGLVVTGIIFLPVVTLGVGLIGGGFVVLFAAVLVKTNKGL